MHVMRPPHCLRYGLDALLTTANICPDPHRQQVASAILTVIARHQKNATTFYKAELQLKQSALLTTAGIVPQRGRSPSPGAHGSGAKHMRFHRIELWHPRLQDHARCRQRLSYNTASPVWDSFTTQQQGSNAARQLDTPTDVRSLTPPPPSPAGRPTSPGRSDAPGSPRADFLRFYDQAHPGEGGGHGAGDQDDASPQQLKLLEMQARSAMASFDPTDNDIHRAQVMTKDNPLKPWFDAKHKQVRRLSGNKPRSCCGCCTDPATSMRNPCHVPLHIQTL